MAQRAYNSPGVTVSESVVPALAPVVATPSIVAVVGAAAGSQTASERLVLTGTTAVQLANTGVTLAGLVVRLASTNAVLNPGNYVAVQATDPDTTVTGDETYTITRVASPAVAPTVSTAGTGTLTGTYEYAVSFINANGETGIGPSNGPTPITAAGYNLSAIPVGPAGTTGRKVYRKKTVGTLADSTFHLVATIADNATLVLANETTSDATANAAASPVTGILSGDTVVVTYGYTNADYFEATLFGDFDDVADKYGAPFDPTTGAVNSKLSFAIRLALLNGASDVIGVAATADTQSALEAALAKLENEPDVRIVVIANGGSWAPSSLYAHTSKMIGQGFYRYGVVGRDGTPTLIDAATTRAAASSLNDESIRFINVSNLYMNNPITGAKLPVGAQYAAAAAAGMYAGRDVQVPLTRKTVAGFVGISDVRRESEKALDAASGLMVMEERGGVIRIRHDITTAVGNVNTREASVVRAKYELAHRVKDALDASAVGVVLPSGRAASLVETIVSSVLDGLVVEQAINGYSDVKGRLLNGDPTTVEVRFQYAPAYPINNINVVFMINTTTGTFTDTSTPNT